jgi:signal transduction histidine kinase
VNADSERLRQVLENLVTNAIKHSPAGEPVMVELAIENRIDGKWANVTVADRGPGVPVDQLPTLFTRFAAGAGSTGLGLGLYLAARIAAAHGGSLDVNSTPGAGARFTLALPGVEDSGTA